MREKAAAVETIPAWTQLFRRVARSAVSTWKGVRLVWQADRLRASVLFVLYSLQAILGISAAYLSKLVIDALFYPSTVVLSPMIPAVAFVVVSLALDTLPVFIGSQHNLFTATLRAYIDTRLMEKANEIPDLGPFEDSGFHTKVRAFRADEYLATMWLGVLSGTLIGLLRVGMSLAFMIRLASGIPILILSFGIARMVSEERVSSVTFEGREEIVALRRRAEYFASLPLAPEHAHEVKAYRLIPFFKRRYTMVARELLQLISRDQRRLLIHQTVWAVLEVLSFGAGLYYVALHSTATAGDITLFIAMYWQFAEGLRDLYAPVTIGAREGAQVRKMLAFLEANPTMEVPKTGKIPTLSGRTRPGFHVKDLVFSYDGQTPVLEIPDLEIPKGQTVALVGENGAGKSTLIKLLLRLYDPDRGMIYLDGLPLSEYDVVAYRSIASGVFQDFVRYQLTLRQNIGLGRVQDLENSEAIHRAARLAGADRLAEQDVQGYDQQLGKLFGGRELSGGEWQRIALARAFMRHNHAELYIFDEPTSALDAHIEYEILSRMIGVTSGKTVILVSHRLSTVRRASKIIVLDKGRVVEEGDHNSLMRRGGRYAELYEVQASRYRV